ncbi:MAG: NAD(P)H-dependent oxidoreductase subunit E [Gemmatimonadetes bacterium]|nr:NAD(P)H-dependent oxidoreductase subunit E [Gemmatimonadota bacterium]
MWREEVPPAMDAVHAILETHERDPGELLQILIEVQHAYHYIPDAAVELVAEHLRVTRAHVRGVVGFYSFLSDRYLGEYVVYISDNITDRMQGSTGLATYLCNRLGVKLGETRADGRASVHFTSCTGMCDQGPAGIVNGLAVTRLTRQRMDVFAELINKRTPLPEWPREFFLVEDNFRRSDVMFRRPVEPGAALKAAMKRGDDEALKEIHFEEAVDPSSGLAWRRGADETLKELYRSDLRGRGGAGFKAAIKWETCRDISAPERYVVCNADEGEPGTFKDRVLLTTYADLVFEGMTICGYVVGSSRGVLYIRQEYWYLKPHLEAVLERRRTDNLLGRNILGTGFAFDIDIHWGAGAYIAGMETALIESVEGRRAKPRKRWPLPVVAGLNRRPTVVNNVETFADAAMVALKGGAWFAGHGTQHSAGTKLFCVSGDCERPGIYEYPFGVSVRELLRDCGGLDAQAVQISGPSGITISRLEFDRILAYEDLSTVGTCMIFGPQRDMFDAVRNFTQFFRHESCGLCTPCRVGTSLLSQLVEKVAAGKGSPVDVQEIERICQLLKSTAHCGLGQTVPNHLIDSLLKFRGDWDKRLVTTDFVPAFDLDAALHQARELTGRDDALAHL